jgi:radical SAM protein with 4Fe4S-binding SPASM domain
MLAPATFHRIIDELSPGLTYLTFYFQGEPYLNPDFNEMVRYAANLNIYTATSTNAHHITPELATKIVASGLNRLIISVDGATPDVYQTYRIGGSLTKVIEGTKNIIQARTLTKRHSLHIIWQFIVFKHNEHQIEEVKQLAHALGVDEVRIKTAQVYEGNDPEKWIPDNEQYSRYALEALQENSVLIKSKLLNHCWRMWQGCVFTWDGDVVPCCFDKDASHKLGNILSQSFKQIYKSTAYKNFRAALLISRKEIDICRNCSEGTKVWES